MVEKPEALYGEVQGVVGYWYPEMDMDMWLKPILEKAEKLPIYVNYPPMNWGACHSRFRVAGTTSMEATDDDRPVDIGAPNPCRADLHYSTVGAARIPEPPRVYTGAHRCARSGILSPRVPALRGDTAFKGDQEIFKHAPIPPPNKFGGFLGGIL